MKGTHKQEQKNRVHGCSNFYREYILVPTFTEMNQRAEENLSNNISQVGKISNIINVSSSNSSVEDFQQDKRGNLFALNLYL